MKALIILASIIAAIAIWWLLLKVATGFAIFMIAAMVIGLPIAGLAYALYKLIMRK